ncbi:MAG: peptidyl-prolyl cis-trans isomerase, partial [Planctomycetaceae bacterium]|nr:peptidyl-prolyl cis-trans isomerase [Planctomycetaceae bacterium]
MKNQFYLVILIVSLAVCGVVIFRPQTADRVLGLLGWHDGAARSPIAPETEWDDLPVPALSAPALSSQAQDGFAFSFGHDTDGFAIANPSQAMMQPAVQPAVQPTVSPAMSLTVQPVQPVVQAGQFDMPIGLSFGSSFGVPDEGYAMSGARQAAPDFVLPEASPMQGQGFAGFVPVASNFDDASNVVPASVTPDFSPFPPPSPVIDVPAAGFAGFALPPQVVTDTAASERVEFNNNPANTSPAATLSEASIVMPDRLMSDFSDYRLSDASARSGGQLTPSALDARIIPPPEPIPISWVIPDETLDDLTQSRIVQPVRSPTQTTSEFPVIPVQGMIVPDSSAIAQPIGGPQFPPATPISEIPLYVPPQGNQPIVPPEASRQVAGIVPNANANINAYHLANNPANDRSNDRRAQYEERVLTEMETVFATDMLARIGARNVIMTCDILAEVREELDNRWVIDYRKAVEEYGQQPSAEEERNYKAEGMQILFEQILNPLIEVQLLYLDMTLSVPNEAVEETKKRASQAFDDEILPKMMKQYGVTNRYDLDAELRKYGTTLERKKAGTVQKQLALSWFNEIVKFQKIMPSHDDMMRYYDEHKDDRYKILGQAKWKELAVLFSETANEQEAYAKIAALGNRVQKGEPFADVAKQGSQGVSAYFGGDRETTVGSLRTGILEKAVFSLPLGSMSQIIRDDTGGPHAGLYIVYVTERQNTRYTPFDQVQGEIKNALLEERFQKEQQRVLTQVRNKYPVVKADNLQQIILAAAEAERNLPIVDTPERRAALLAKAERLAPSKKTVVAPLEQQPPLIASGWSKADSNTADQSVPTGV